MYNNKVLSELNKSINNNELLHSYIFTGIYGIGKRDTAFEFAKNIICDNDIQKNKFENNNHPDYTYIKPTGKGSIKIETIRQIIKDISIKPIESKYKVYVIDDADAITPQAQNAFLKTLEEPPSYAVIILITSNYYGLLDTIRSRSQQIVFNKLNNNEILDFMKNKNVNIDIKEDILLFLIDGRTTRIDSIKEDVNIIKDIISLLNSIEKMNLIELYNIEKNILECKDNIFNVLEYMISTYGYILSKNLNNILKINKSIELIEQCKKNIKSNINFEISIDNLLQNLWEEWNV